MDILEHKYLLFLFLLFDCAENFLKAIIAVLVPDDYAAGIITMIVFLTMALLLVLSATIGLRFTTVTSGSFLAWLLQVSAIVMFYYGDNAPSILHRYGSLLGCGFACQDNSQTAAIFFLGTGLLIQYNIPLLYRDGSRASGGKYQQQWWNYAFNMITVFLATDIFYSLIAAFTAITATTSPKLFLSVSFFVVSIVIGWISIIINFCYTQISSNIAREKKEKKEKKRCDLSLAFVAAVLMVSLPFYLLADNEQPLSYTLRCNGTTPNATFEQESTFEEKCDMFTSDLLRLIFMAVPASSIAAAFGVFLCKWCNDKHRDEYDGFDNTA